MSATVPPPQEIPPLSEGQRLIDVFIAPTKTFTDLRRNASWWAPYLAIVIVSLLFIYVVDQKVGFQKVTENQMQTRPAQAERIENMPPDQRQKVIAQSVALTKIISYSIPVVVLLLYAVYAAVLFGTLKLVANADMAYKTMYALIVYSRLPELIRVLLAVVSLLAGISPDSFNIENPIAVNPGYFIEPAGSSVLRALLTPIDLISIWTLILVAIGIPCISKVKRGTAFGVVFGWYVLLILARVGLAAMF